MQTKDQVDYLIPLTCIEVFAANTVAGSRRIAMCLDCPDFQAGLEKNLSTWWREIGAMDATHVIFSFTYADPETTKFAFAIPAASLSSRTNLARIALDTLKQEYAKGGAKGVVHRLLEFCELPNLQ